jgi:signal transduction histidine kinase
MRYIPSFLQKSTILFLLLLLGKDGNLYAQNANPSILSNDFLFSLSKDSLINLEKETRVTDLNTTYRIHDILILKAKISKNSTETYDAFNLKGKQFLAVNQYQNALAYFDSAALVVKNIDFKLFFDTQIDRAVVFQQLHRYGEARTIYLNILAQTENSKDTLYRHVSLCNLGVLFEETGDYQNAIRYYKEALIAVESEKNNTYICSYLANLSEAYKSNNQPNEAFFYIQRAYSIAMSDQDLELKNRIFIGYAHILADLGRFEEAFTKIEEGTKYCEGEYAKRYFNNISIAKAEIFYKQKNIAATKEVFLECYNRLQNIANKTKITYQLGAIYFDENNMAKAKLFLTECQQLAEQNNILTYAEKSHRLLYSLFSKEKNAVKALFHLESANSIRDTLLNFEKSEQISALQFKFDLEQSENKLKTTELSAGRQLMLLGGLLALCIFTAMFYIIYLRNRNYHDVVLKNTLIEAQKLELEDKNKTLELQKKQLEESNVLLKQFSYAVAHDLKEPMRTISNFSSIIQRRYKAMLPEESHEYFNFVTSGAKRMTAMLDGLLQYAIVSTKNEEIEEFALNDVLEEVTQSLYKKIEDSHAIITMDKEMPKVNMSRLHAIQLVQNLISNGLKFVEKEPSIEIKSQIVNHQVVISIKDNGIGIDKDSGAKLFNLFHRAHRDTSRFEGTGVGLALCKNIAEKYHGKIWFESEVNEGTTFFVELPLAA